ncbi:MAG: single-stranded-DNA-specific exonuclease RecJ [Synechococcales bacterium]|nr:single-stranded-DNA-specific exonuclease RecJ [Synechococcales bacterium]
MTDFPLSWRVVPQTELPPEFVQAVQRYVPGRMGHFATQLFWQRSIRDIDQLVAFIDPAAYQPTSPFAFGEEMEWAIARLQQAMEQQERVAIWGDFDADGITATAVLWEGLGQFFPQVDRLTYYVPNRLTESHGLSQSGLEELAQQGVSLVVTCDTGSTHATEIAAAQTLGMDVIVTDHHTLPEVRPGAIALINPRTLPADHPLAPLSGVAVAYKLVEALYERFPSVPTRPLSDLLDLVAIGLIADLVELRGDGRYLAQRGIEQLKQLSRQTPSRRPGITKLLELCRRTGDRPTDISFGIGPRINAISRIQGDASFCVELLTSQDKERCQQLALETELANTRRQSLQRAIAQEVGDRLDQMDLSTHPVIVLEDPQWSVGVLGLVAGQIAQEYGRPTILLRSDPPTAPTPLARGSARSTQQIDLYQLIQPQAHLLHRFGGHPFAAGLSLPLENLALFRDAINREFREQHGTDDATQGQVMEANLTVTVADLGQDLFRALNLLEPYGVGNPVPRLLIRDCWFERVWHRRIQDLQQRKTAYIKTEFELWDETVQRGFPGIWWGHYRDDVPTGRCHAIIELDFRSPSAKGGGYQARLVAVCAQSKSATWSERVSTQPILDWRKPQPSETEADTVTATPQVPPLASMSENSGTEMDILSVDQCPTSWDELQNWVQQARQQQKILAIAYPPPDPTQPEAVWQQLVGIAKYLDRTGKSATCAQIQNRLQIGDRTLTLGLEALRQMGIEAIANGTYLTIRVSAPEHLNAQYRTAAPAIQRFLAAVQEERFRQRYFCEAPLAAIQAAAERVDWPD